MNLAYLVFVYLMGALVCCTVGWASITCEFRTMGLYPSHNGRCMMDEVQIGYTQGEVICSRAEVSCREWEGKDDLQAREFRVEASENEKR